jgi:hypothetical protein
VQRWEKREGLPIHRHHHHKLGSVYAFRSELDAWRTHSRDLNPSHQLTKSHGARKVVVIAVLPFENLSGDPQQEYFVDGITDAVTSSAATIDALRVIARTALMRLKQTRPPLRDIARAWKLDAVVEGSLVRSGDRVPLYEWNWAEAEREASSECVRVSLASPHLAWNVTDMGAAAR